MDRLIEPLRSTCTNKVKANSVKQEYEKQDELKRSAMRAFLSLMAIPDADKNHLVMDFMTYIRTTPDLQQLFEQIQRDSNSADSGVPMEIS
jgi:cullin-associated NEDD8-dissociated protein 1